MLSENAVITISGLQIHVDNEQPVELTCLGNYTKKGDAHYISYDELDEDGKVSKCRIKVTDSNVDYTKTGNTMTQMFFEVGENFESIYDTPFGEFQMGLDTKKLTVRERAACDAETDSELLYVCLEYGLSINGSFVSDCKLCVKVEEK